MKKLLTATTALALVGGAAFAEITISGSAEFAFDYDSDPKADDDGNIPSKHNFNHDFNVGFAGSGTTDGGLTFGGSAGFDSESGGGSSLDEGKVFVSGAFGKITFGDNDSADKLAGGIADIGLNGIGVDDIAEKYGGTANQLRYDHTFGAVSIAVSAGTTDGKAGTPEVPAVGANYWWVDAASDNQRHLFGTNPTPEQWEPVLGFTRTDAGVPQFGTTAMTGYGYLKAADGVTAFTDEALEDYTIDDDGFVLDPQGNRVPVADPSTLLAAAATATGGLEGEGLVAFLNYAAAYDLGEDMLIGGDDDNEDKLKKEFVQDDSRAAVAAVAGTSADNQYAFGMSFNAGGVTVGVGHDSLENTSVGLAFNTGDIGTNMLYVKGSSGNSVGADVSYAMGASTLTLAYARYSPDMASDPKQTGMGLGVVHDLGGGASLNAGFGQVDDDKGMSHNKASVGLSFAF